jgi:hypothetical protein
MYITQFTIKKMRVVEHSLRSGQQISLRVYGIVYYIGCLSLFIVDMKGIWSSPTFPMFWLKFPPALLRRFPWLLFNSRKPWTFAIFKYNINLNTEQAYYFLILIISFFKKSKLLLIHLLRHVLSAFSSSLMTNSQ